MKTFFLELLNNLHNLAGLRQIEKIFASHPKPENAKAEVNELMELLVKVSKQFPYIPEKDQQNIIAAAVISDPEFNSLNARIVFKWLAQHRDKYFKESQHIEEKPQENWVPLTGEARLKRLKEWEQALGKFEEHTTATDRVAKKRAAVYGDSEPVLHKSTPVEEVEKMQLHNQWIRESFDKLTGKPLPGALTEEEWLKHKTV